MTPTRYYIARLGQFFGIIRKNQRMSDAATEAHLLRDAEAYLGAAVWENAENIEPLSSGYWTLRKLFREKEALLAKMEECQSQLDQAHDERASLMTAALEPTQKLLNERATMISELEKMGARRDKIIKEAKEVRKTYEGLKLKLEFLSESDAANPEIDKVKARLTDLKGRFNELKDQRDEIGHKIESGDKDVERLDEQIAFEKSGRKAGASGVLQTIGVVNKSFTLLRSELGTLDSRIHHYQLEIGRYISRNASIDSACAKAAAKQRGLVSIMRALRHSIQLNHRLAGLD